MKVEDLKIAYIHARPHGHPIHEAYANTLNPVRFYIDYLLRWHDLSKPAIIRYLSWFLCAIFFPKKSKYDVFYADGPIHFLAIMKLFRIIKPKQKIVFLMADETLSFLKNKYYTTIADKTLRWVIGKADGLICIGDQQLALAKELFPNIASKIIYNAVNEEHFQELLDFEPDFKTKNVFSVCNIGDSDVRKTYKGLDIMVTEMDAVLSIYPEMKYFIYGQISKRIVAELIKNVTNIDRVLFMGEFEVFTEILKNKYLCLHLSRGDAYPTSTLECALAGMPVLVSESTGTKNILKAIDTCLVYKNKESLINLIENPNLVLEISTKSKKIAGQYKTEAMHQNFKNTFLDLVIMP